MPQSDRTDLLWCPDSSFLRCLPITTKNESNGRPLEDLSSGPNQLCFITTLGTECSYIRNHQQTRPMSSRNLEQYAYAPQEDSSKSVQMAPRLFQRTNNSQSDQNHLVDPSTNAKSVPPSQFKPASSFMGTHARILPAHRQTDMGPPPTPQHVRSSRENTNTGGNPNNGQVPNPPGSSRLANLPPPRSHQQLNVPATPVQSSSAGVRRFFPSGGQSIGVRNPSRSSNLLASGGQRTPFVPQVQNGRQGGFG
ncbi:hypothetical protein M413DRAFT_438099 [Hebeloma cylindrosporum]|uniref:Uncharacterized protein n=1 Tax=Hebeloma cylindrosporum TaxID=76867 RepID=A0A0C3CXN6_HEBCY|nr:hypothetical protein M413DRAFT_438099 [Hebeloma cylindrosporum h7]